MNETTFTRQVMQNWQRQHPTSLQWWKIPDYTRPGFSYSNNRFVDVIAVYDGKFYGMEWKLKKDNRAFPLNRVRDSQLETLRGIHNAGGIALLMIGVYINPHEKHVYAIPIWAWDNATKAINNRKSIDIEKSFPACRIEPYRANGYVHWNMLPVEIMKGSLC